MNHDQHFLDLLTTVIGSLKQNFIRWVLAINVGNVNVDNKCWKHCALQNFTAAVLSRLFGVWSILTVIPFLLVVSFFRVLPPEHSGQFCRLRETPQCFCFDE